jgi:hypothetical protein
MADNEQQQQQMSLEEQRERWKEAQKAKGEEVADAGEKADEPAPELEGPEEVREMVQSIDPEEVAEKIVVDIGEEKKAGENEKPEEKSSGESK